jgi:starch phosphorylase
MDELHGMVALAEGGWLDYPGRHAAVNRMRESMAQLTPRFSTNRAVREYTEQHYLPAASAYRERAADKGKLGAQLVEWRHALEQKWATLRFGEVKVESDDGQHIFEVQVYLDDLDPKAVRVELYADGVGDATAERVEMRCVRQLVGAVNGYVYRAGMQVTRPATDYTARLIPHHEDVAVPLEDVHILWQR